MKIRVANGLHDDLDTEVHVQAHHIAGDVARYAAELMATPGVWTLFRNGEALADNDPLGTVNSDDRLVIA